MRFVGERKGTGYLQGERNKIRGGVKGREFVVKVQLLDFQDLNDVKYFGDPHGDHLIPV